MAFNIEAILKDEEPDLTLEDISRALSTYVPQSTISMDDGCPPIIDKHLVVTISENDFGENGSWSADVLLEKGEMVNQCNIEAVMEDGKDREDKDKIENSHCRVRVYFRSDDDQKYTNTMIDLISFLESIPNAAVFDSQQCKFLN